MSYRMSTTCIAMLVFAGSFLAAGCGGSDSPTSPPTTQPPAPTPTPTPPTVSSIEVSPNTVTLVVGRTQGFVATAKASDGSVIGGVNFTWSSSNTAVVTINSGGVAKAESVGTATIRATGNGVTSAPATIKVNVPPVSRVTVSPSSAQEMMVGEMTTFTATARTAGGTVRDDVSISWSSSDTTVVTISSAGVATAVAVGTATIRASAEGINSSPVSVMVSETPPPVPVIASVELSPSSMTLGIGGTFQFMAMALTSDGMAVEDVTFTWASDDTEIATVDSLGLVTAVAAGTAMITASANGITSMAAPVTVEEMAPEVASVMIVDAMPVMLEVGDTHQLMAVAQTSEGTMIGGVAFSWSSDDNEVATVDSTGLVAAVGAGMANVIAVVKEVTSDPVNVTVAEPPPVVDRITVEPTTASIEEGETQQFSATAYESDNTEISGKRFTWKSSDTGKATINSTGLATGKDAGTTTITATVDGVSGMATLTVSEPPPPVVVATVTVSPSQASIEEGETQQFSATAYESDNTEISGKRFTWKSSDTGKATINSTGLATGKDAGTTTITATVDGVSGMATLTVSEPPPPPVVVATVTVSPSQASIEEGETQQFSATAYESDNTEISGKRFTWKSSDTGKATINSTGLATGKDAGTTTITATVDGVSGMATLTVSEPPPPPVVVATVTVSPSQASIEEGETQQFSATAYESDNTEISGKRFTWKSSDTGKATINSTGLATGKDAGTTTITATVDGVSGMATLTVSEPPPPPVVVATVTVSPSQASIEEGETQQFSATAYESDNTEISGKRFTWKSSDTGKATINSTGLATGKDAGTTTITATVDGVSGMATLTVSEPPPPPVVVATVTVSPSQASIEEGETQQFSATAYESDNTEISGKRFTWKSSDTGKATINSTGLATGKDAGTTTITATVDGVSGMATLTVSEPPPPPVVVATVTVSPSQASIEEGETQQFSATAYESDNTEISGKRFTWKSSDTGKATINSTGLATGKDAGTTTITATVDGVSGMATLTVSEPPPPPVVVATVTVSPSQASIEEGETQQFSATAYESDNTEISGKRFTWKSSDTGKATINSTGLATGKDAGTTTITATVDGVSGMATLTVSEPPPPPVVVATVTVSPSQASIEEGETQQFSATAYESDNTEISGKRFTWKSSDTGKATINSTGLATGKDAGTTTITATVDGVSGMATLTVSEPPPPPVVVATVTVSPSQASIEEGETQQFSATAYESDNTEISGKRFTWKSSDTGKATINSTGLATGKDAGTTTITATVDGVSGMATLTVSEPPPPPVVVATVTVSPSQASIEEGETQQFSATAYESDNTEISGKRFTWKSSDTGKATINSTGLATGKDAGTTTITATVDGVSGMATLTVSEPPPMLRSRTGTISGRNNYRSGGSVTLSETSDGKLKLSITGLSTPGGAPDVFVALYTSSDINWPNGGSLPDSARGFGEVSRQSGNKSWTFTPAGGEDIDSWSHLILHCRLINREVGSASLSN